MKLTSMKEIDVSEVHIAIIALMTGEVRTSEMSV
jgi:hypothetical protein